MCILVTGGSGFIGSALIRYLVINRGISVVNVDSLTYAGNTKNLEKVELSSLYNFEHTNICDHESLLHIFDKYKPTAVMHLAAESHVDKSIENSSPFIQTNIVGTYNMLETSRSYWENLSKDDKNNFRFHHISTDEVYGDLPHPEDDPNAHNHLFTESSPYSPSSPYSASKAASDHLVRAWFKTYGLPIILTNCSNNYGPYQFPEKLIPMTILNALSGNDLTIYGSGNQIRDWLYVEDHVTALYKALKDGVVGETYNIGGKNELSNIDVVYTICKILDEILPKKKSYKDQIVHIADRPGHDKRYAIDATKICSELDWKPTETFVTGIKKTINWYIENQEWCNKI